VIFFNQHCILVYMTNSSPVTNTKPENAKPASASSDERLLLAGVHILGIPTAFVGALVVYLIKKDEPSQLLEHAKEALNFQLTLAIAYAISFVLSIILIGAFFMMILSVFNIVMCIVAAVKAYEGKSFRYPATLRLIK
jgi:uncharacterized protein